MIISRIIAITLGSLLLFAPCAGAQQSDSGVVEITVEESMGKQLPASVLEACGSSACLDSTVLLADGLPLYGGSASALGPLDISPVDLQRVEIIKGAASALYGGQALGGVINLVAKPPTGKKEVLLNRRTLDVTDVATWLSHRLGSGSGISFLASGTVQGAEDIDRDGWADQPRARRWNVRPRFNAVDDRGRSLFVTAGYGYDDRDGGTLGGGLAPDGLPFREGLRSTRADFGGTAAIPLQDGGKVAARLALSTSWRAREFGSGPLERDRTSTGFLDFTRSFVRDSATTLWGRRTSGGGRAGDGTLRCARKTCGRLVSARKRGNRIRSADRNHGGD